MTDPCDPVQTPHYHHHVLGRIKHYPSTHHNHPYRYIIGCKKVPGAFPLLVAGKLAAIPTLVIAGAAVATTGGYYMYNYGFGSYTTGVKYVCTKYSHDKKCEHVKPVPEPSTFLLFPIVLIAVLINRWRLQRKKA